MTRRLSGYVPIHREDGEVTWYGPKSKVPAKDAKLIADYAWVDDDADDADDLEDDEPTVPPRTGTGSGVKAWREYAATFEDLEVPAGASVDDIVGLLSAAGHPVE